MEYINMVNIFTVIIVLLMLNCLRKLFTGDIGDNKFFYIMVFVALGMALYVWRSGGAAESMTYIRGAMK